MSQTATPTVSAFVDYVPRRFTVADLAAMPTELPSGTVRYELDHGTLLTMSPPGFDHGFVELGVAAALRRFGQESGLGVTVCGETAVILRRTPDCVYGMDAAFISNERLPVRLSPEGYLETIPDLVVEVVSKNDTKSYLAGKVREYLLAGVRIVWIVDPATRTLTEHHPDTAPTEYDSSAVVELPELIPGFRLSLADVFPACEDE